jgi:hypothetical protein
MGNRHLSLTSISTIFIILFLFTGVFAQKSEKPKWKDFGSSLKRLRWDAEKKTAVDTKSRTGSAANAADLEVVTVETSLVSSDLLVLDERGNAVTGLTADDFAVTEDGTPQKVGMFSLGDNVTVPRTRLDLSRCVPRSLLHPILRGYERVLVVNQQDRSNGKLPE